VRIITLSIDDIMFTHGVTHAPQFAIYHTLYSTIAYKSTIKNPYWSVLFDFL